MFISCVSSSEDMSLWDTSKKMNLFRVWKTYPCAIGQKKNLFRVRKTYPCAIGPKKTEFVISDIVICSFPSPG